MKTEIRGLALSFVDFMGALLPGIVWLILIATAIDLGRCPLQRVDANPWHSVVQILSGNMELDLVKGLAIVVAALLLGYLIKPAVMGRVEWMTRPESLWRRPARDQRFPYRTKHNDQGYFTEIESYLNDNYPRDWESLSGHQPFTICKRIVKSIDPNLWEECEYREAELRLIGSLFLASIFSLVLSVIGLFLGVRHAVWWFWISVGAALYFACIFRQRREREAGYTFMMFHVAIRKNVDRDSTV